MRGFGNYSAHAGAVASIDGNVVRTKIAKSCTIMSFKVQIDRAA